MTVWTWPGATVVRVIDGDSVIVQVTRDVGFHGTLTFQQRIRLNRINCPPLATATGTEARVYVDNALTARPFLLDTVGAYKYGDEWQGEITLADGRNLSDALVAASLAVYWDGHGPRPGG